MAEANSIMKEINCLSLILCCSPSSKVDLLCSSYIVATRTAVFLIMNLKADGSTKFNRREKRPVYLSINTQINDI